jgi:hypothetical protein
MASVALTGYILANAISDAKSERTTDQQRNHNVRGPVGMKKPPPFLRAAVRNFGFGALLPLVPCLNLFLGVWPNYTIRFAGRS